MRLLENKDECPLRVRWRPIVTDAALLRQVSLPVEDWHTVTDLVEELAGICMHHAAFGLAAPQIGELTRVIVINIPIDGVFRVMGFINPEITWRSQEKETLTEACLSLPGVRHKVRRPRKIRLKFIGGDGIAREVGADGAAARALQHEIDHLDGILITDRSKGLN